MANLIFETKHYVLTVGEDCIAKSLILKATGEECLMEGEPTALFSLTEDRPYNNEIKLAHPNKKTTFEANRIRREGNRLIVGFELLLFDAVVEVKEAEDYIAFQLKEFLVDYNVFGLDINPLPVAEFRLVQLPIKKRERFGEWLNVMWDDNVAVNVLSTCPFTRIDSQKRKDHRVMYADALRDVRLLDCSAALIVSKPEELLDCIESVEKDYDLPRGVQSRRNRLAINASVYHVTDLNPATVDEHIAYAKQGGFRYMLVYYTSMVKEGWAYSLCGDYDYNENYPNGAEDMKLVLEKVRAAGITPGFHFLQTHIGVESRYVTPKLDHRLNIVRNFTLSRPISAEDDVIYVEQNPVGSSMTMNNRAQVLAFGKEAIHYDGFTTEYPYCFTGCKRGYYGTTPVTHEEGTRGGILDVSEYGGVSIYVDQETSLQDEVAKKIAAIYDLGFEFVYFDGSEGAKPPFEIYVPYAQYRVYRALEKAPLFCEGAAKAHFSWHMLSGGNAFDVFPMPIFKEKIAQYPLEEAPRMANDFTRVNFGWWRYDDDTQPDIYEYGTSKAASWDCPATMQCNVEKFHTNPRTDDVFEVMRRWEDVRVKNWLTQEQKEALRDPDTEYTLLINEEKEYELVPYEKIDDIAGGEYLVEVTYKRRGKSHEMKKRRKLKCEMPDGWNAAGQPYTEYEDRISVFVLERKGKACVVCWDTRGESKIWLPLAKEALCYEAQLGGEVLPIDAMDGGSCIAVAGKRYLSTTLSKEELVAAWKQAKIIE